MSKIDVSQWKEFKLSSMFDVTTSKSVDRRYLDFVDDSDAVNFVGRGTLNNGIQGRILPEHVSFKPNSAHTMSLSQIGNNWATWHDAPWFASQNVFVLTPISERLARRKARYFIQSVINRNLIMYYNRGYDKYPKQSDIRDMMLTLPVDSSGDPDWHYMDEYIAKRAALAHKYVSELKSTKNQREPLKISGWQEYKISQLFNIRPSNYIRENGKAISNRQLLNGGSNPVVVNSSVNNGIGGTTSYEPTEHGNVITYSDTVDGNTIFYQAKPFVGYSHVKVMEPKENRDPAEMIFLTAVIGRRLSDGNYDYTNKMTTNQVLNTTIKLPALSDGTPDWATMRKRVAHLAALSHRDVTSLDPAELPIFVGDWKEVPLSLVYQHVEHPKSRSKKRYAEGLMPFIASGSVNNGIDCYLMPKDENDYDKGDCLTISPVDGSTFYQSKKFLGRGGGGSSIIILRSNFQLSESIQLFLASCIQRKLKQQYSYNSMGTGNQIKQLSIKLPVDSTGHPDWQYMNNYVEFMKLISDRHVGSFQNIINNL